MNTIKVAGTGPIEDRVEALEQAVNYGEVVLPFTVVNDQDVGGGTVGPPGPQGPAGPQGIQGPAGPGVPLGGTTGQQLQKVSSTDYDTAWTTPPTIPTTLPPSGPAGGDLSGSYPNPTLAPSGVAPSIYGNATNVPVLDIRSDGRVYGATNTLLPTSLPPSGAASGDLTGTYPGPTVAAGKITAPKLSPAPVAGDVGKMVTIATGPALAYTALPTSLPPSGSAGGDLTGTYPNPTIGAGKVTTAAIADAPNGVATAKLNDGAVTDAKIASVAYAKVTGAPTSLPPSGSASGDLTGTYPGPTITAGAVTTTKLGDAPNGVTTAKINDGAVTNVKITDVAWTKITGAPTSFPPSGAAGGDLSGTYPNPTVAKVNGAAVGVTTPLARGDLLVADAAPALTRLPLGTASQVLQSDGTDVKWGASLGGPPSGAAGGSLTGTYPNPTIADGAVTRANLSTAAKKAYWG